MDQVRLIHDFVDGMLDSGQEESLFLALSSSDELRGEMKDLLAMKQAARTYTEVYTPSASSTMAVFGSLGFDRPKLAYSSSGNIGWAARTTNFYRRNSNSVKTGIASSVITAILAFFLLQPDDAIFNISSAGINGKSGQAQLLNNSAKNEIPVVASSADMTEKVSSLSMLNSTGIDAAANTSSDFASAMHKRNSGPNSAPADVTNIGAVNTNAADTAAGNINEDIETANSSINSAINQADNFAAAVNMSEIGKSGQFTSPLPGHLEFNSFYYIPRTANVRVAGISDFRLQDLDGFTVELRGSQNWNSEKATINPADNALFNNYSLAVFYDLSEVFSIGYDLRQETFFNQFYGADNDGVMKTYETQPNYTSHGLALRYYILPSESFKPLAQLTFGGNSVGLTSRFMAGLKYEPYRDIAFIIGLEYSNLTYWFDNNSFNSSKLGLNYGVQFLW